MLVGGAMIGPQSSTVQQQLGPLLNGVVNYEYWLPTSAMAFPGVQELISRYQAQARGTQADALGYYVAPCAYAQLQVVEQAIRGTDGLDDAELAGYTHAEVFHTVMGDIRFGPLGEWDQPRVLTVQFQNIGSNDIEQFRSPERASRSIASRVCKWKSSDIRGCQGKSPVNVHGISVVVKTTDRQAAVEQYSALLESDRSPGIRNRDQWTDCHGVSWTLDS